MLNSGIGFFEHSGQIDGNRLVEFPVKVDDINDLLKSLIVQDRGGGRVTAANYGSPEPIAQTLKTLAIDVTPESAVVSHLSPVARGKRSNWQFPATPSLSAELSWEWNVVARPWPRSAGHGIRLYSAPDG